MADERPQPELLAELEDLRRRLAEAEEVVRAIRSGSVDAVVVAGDRGERRVYTLSGADRIYRQFIEMLSEGAAAVSAAGVILYANLRMAEMLRRPLEQVLGTVLRDYLPPGDHQALGTLPQEAGASPGHREISLVAADGRRVPVYLSASRLPMEDGEWVTLFVLTDLTEHRSHERLVAAERLARLILEQAAEVIIVCDPEGRVTRASQAAQSLCAGSPLTKPFAEAFPLRTRTSAPFLLAPVLQGEAVRDVDVVIERGGEQVALILNAGPLSSGRQILGCVITLTDITGRKQAEATRIRLTMAIEQSAEAVMVTDAQGAIEYVNPAFERTTGYTRAEVLGQNLLFLKSGAPDEAYYRTLWETISGGKTWRGRLLNRKKGGETFTEDASISPVRDEAGRITSYVAVKRDISHDLALEAQLLQSQRIESIGRLTGGIAHDFNNLISVMLSYSGFALEGLLDGDPRRDDILEVKIAAERAAALTRQLLAFSRNQVLQPVLLSLNKVAERVEKMLRRVLGEDIDLLQRLAPDLGLTRADPGQIEQVLLNLVVNARDAMPAGGNLTIETGNVHVGEEYAASHVAVQPGPYVQLTVTDSGCGMDLQTQTRIFEPFFTTKEPGKGTGLGLSTVYGIVRQSGGTIWVYSEPGRGTTFKILLPRDLTATSATPGERPAAPTRLTGTETILLVEDEEALRRVARRALQSAGYTVLTAENGEEALRAIAQHVGDVHLLVTDVIMPKMGGQLLAQEVSKTRPVLKVLYMSGYTGDAVVHHGVLEAGVNFLAKPFIAAELLRKVREVLDGGGGHAVTTQLQAPEDHTGPDP
jgi:two-component system, cell cycle sensor histidine kinase and response regulator CckA